MIYAYIRPKKKTSVLILGGEVKFLTQAGEFFCSFNDYPKIDVFILNKVMFELNSFTQ